MAENLMTKDHKASNDRYREGYDKVFRSSKDKKEEGKDEYR